MEIQFLSDVLLCKETKRAFHPHLKELGLQPALLSLPPFSTLKLMCRVSLIIPCYRDSATLERAIKSVLVQTRLVDELIVVNDCSPETSEIEQVLQAYGNIIYIKNPSNLGLAATRNKGVAVASGDVVTFLDADDELHPQKIEVQLKVLRGNAAVTCSVRKVVSGEVAVTSATYLGTTPVRTVTGNGRMLFGNTLTGAAILVPRKLMMQVGGYDERLRSCEDYDLWLRFIEAGVTVYDIRWPLYIYHYNVSGLSKNFLNVSYWELEVLRKYFNRNNRMPLNSLRDACIWAFWLIKHLIRYEKCGDETLRLRTVQNMDLLSKYPCLRSLISFANNFHLFKLYALLR